MIHEEDEQHMQTATVDDVQDHLPELLDRVELGEEVLIVRAGKPVGRLVAAQLPSGAPIPGRGKGKLVIHSDDDEHLKDFTEYMP
jgi:prevent-host-death family protein